MTIEEATGLLKRAGYTVTEKNRLGNETGWQLRFLSPRIVNVFDNGNCNVQGKASVDIEDLLNCRSAGTSPQA